MQLITQEWAEAYTAAWNNDPVIAKKLRKFTSVFKYAISDREDLEPVIIKVEKGVCTSYGTNEHFVHKTTVHFWSDSNLFKCSSFLKFCFTSTETTTDGEPRTSTSTLTQLLSSEEFA